MLAKRRRVSVGYYRRLVHNCLARVRRNAAPAHAQPMTRLAHRPCDAIAAYVRPLRRPLSVDPGCGKGGTETRVHHAIGNSVSASSVLTRPRLGCGGS